MPSTPGRVIDRHVLELVTQLLETSLGTVWKEPNSRDESVNTASLLRLCRQSLLTVDVSM